MKNKKTLYIIPAIILCLFLNGCRNYQELENLSVVAGIAVDKAQDGEGYLVSLEVIDTSAPVKENKEKSKIIESEGKTVYDAINKANKKLFNKPYFGNAQVLIISRKIAESEGIENIIEGFLRDTEPRETIEVTISRGETAKEIITPDNDGKYIYSYEIKKNLDGGKKNSNQLKNMELYKVYNELKRNSGNLLLPAFICAEKKETQEEEKDKIKKETEADGFAIFQKDKLIGWLDYGDVLYYMLINGSVKGSVFAFPLENQAKNNVSLTILKSSSKKSFEVDISGEKKAKINIELRINAELNELPAGFSPDIKSIKLLETKAAEILSQRINGLIKKMQSQAGADIFGFGTMIYKKDYKLWQQINTDWETLFRNAEIKINTEIKISRTGFIKN